MARTWKEISQESGQLGDEIQQWEPTADQWWPVNGLRRVEAARAAHHAACMEMVRSIRAARLEGATWALIGAYTSRPGSSGVRVRDVFPGSEYTPGTYDDAAQSFTLNPDDPLGTGGG